MLRAVEVNNVQCEGCANTIKKTLTSKGFKNVEVDLSCEPRKVTINIENEASLAQLRTILRKLGYPFSDEEVSLANSATLKAKSFISCTVGKFSVKNNVS